MVLGASSQGKVMAVGGSHPASFLPGEALWPRSIGGLGPLFHSGLELPECGPGTGTGHQIAQHLPSICVGLRWCLGLHLLFPFAFDF